MYNYTCRVCKLQFESPELLPNTSGQFLARSAVSDQRAVLNAMDDRVYDEVESILESLESTVGLNDNQKADLLLRVFGEACDPAADGSNYLIAVKPQCPQCGSREHLSWEASDPARFHEEVLEEFRDIP